jgi:hypothetical protein
LLGSISGFAGLVWLLFNLIFGSYEGFKKEMSMLKTFYTFDEGNKLVDFENPHKDLSEILAKKK